jgi:hypothetical protein
VDLARDERPWRTTDYFHVGSYFMAFRSEVVADAGFRYRLDTVARQSDKNSIVRKYEIGISAYLTLAGYRVDTFIDGVLPFHPLYRESAFELMEEGLPFLKRQFLHENFFDVPELERWYDRVHAVFPDADRASVQANLERVSPVYNLQRALDVHTEPDGSVRLPELIEEHNFHDAEEWAPRFEHWWGFAADPTTRRLEGNVRAVFEAVRTDPTIKKIVVAPAGSPVPGGANVAVVPSNSQQAIWYLLRCGTIFVTDGPRADLPHPLSGDTHRFVGLHRGTALLSYGATTPVDPDGDRTRHHEANHDLDLTRFVCASSAHQKRAIRPAVSSPSAPRVWVTGTPRVDLLVRPEAELPADLRAQLGTLRRATRGRPLVVWAPAGRGEGRTVPSLDDDLDWIRDWADRHDAVVGFRPPPGVSGGERDGVDRRALRRHGVRVLSPRVLPDVEMVLREAAALVSDYTEELMDYLVLDRPALAFVPDLDEVTRHPGLLHSLDDIVPGRVCRDRRELRAAWEHLLDDPDPEAVALGALVRDRTHAYRDAGNGDRLVRRVRRTYLPKDWFADAP